MIIWFLLSLIATPAAAADPNHISINCGVAAPATALSGRKWGGDWAPEGSSTAAIVEGELTASVDPVPYLTARASRSNFSYTFHLEPGQKSLRLHFNPAPYRGFEGFNDFFTVESGPFTLLANFSASVTARALSRDILVKEFCINIKENEALNLVFYPETSQLENNYAFINGIDIISLPPMFADIGVPMLGQNSVIYVDNSTALERVHYQHVKWGSFSSSDDVGGMFGMWAEPSLKKTPRRANNKTWSVSVDVGFMYLVRLHLCEVELEVDFALLINNIVSLTNAEMRGQRGNRDVLWYNNYMVMVGGLEREDDHDILISLQSQHDFMDRHGPLEGFEVFKLSNHHRTLASPSLVFPREKSPSHTLQTLLHSLQALLYDLHGPTRLWGYTFFLNICIIVIILGHQMSGDNCAEKDNKPLAWKKDNEPLACKQRRYGRFSQAEFDAYVENFIERFEKDGFGKAYQGSMDNGRDIVTIKRIKTDHKPEEHGWKEDNKPLAWKQRLCRRFSLAEIQAATENFNERFVLGKGGFGKFYKGFMDNGREIVTIKRIKTDHKQGEHGFWTEIEILCELRHVNLVSLIGYCREQNETLLVYEYFPGVTLADHIYKLANKKNDFHPLSWKQRLKICIGVGRALDYLHTGCRIIHRDLKASNIMLDENFLPKISDFSLVKWASGGEYLSQDSKNLGFTLGYVDPTYWKTLELTHKSDIYSFGVLLLEVMCGRPAPPWNEQDKVSLITWKGQVDQLVDPSLRGEILPDSVKTFVKVAEGSLHDEPEKRPDIRSIVAKLELALLQQEKGESVAPNERIRVEDVFSCTDKSQEENEDFIEPSDKMNVENDASPSKGHYRNRYLILLSDTWDAKWDLEEKSPGKAGHGVLYAVEKLNYESMQGFKEWQSQSNFLRRKLLGHCCEDKEQALYEMMVKLSLGNHLFRRGSPYQPLHWDIRLQMIIGVARRHALLHASNARVIHMDLKPSNILLDTSFHAKLSDFGLERSVIGGTYDYLASEYIGTGHSRFKCNMHDLFRSIVENLRGVQVLDCRCRPGRHDCLELLKTYSCERRRRRRRRMVVVDDDMELNGTCPLSAPPLPLLVSNCLESEPEPSNRPSMQEMVDTPDIISSSSNERPRVYFGD